MAQLVVSWFICDGRLRVHAINDLGCRSGRIIEIEDIDTGERVHGSARRLERLLPMGLRCERGDDLLFRACRRDREEERIAGTAGKKLIRH